VIPSALDQAIEICQADLSRFADLRPEVHDVDLPSVTRHTRSMRSHWRWIIEAVVHRHGQRSAQ
jgi:hypothetical protein